MSSWDEAKDHEAKLVALKHFADKKIQMDLMTLSISPNAVGQYLMLCPDAGLNLVCAMAAYMRAELMSYDLAIPAEEIVKYAKDTLKKMLDKPDFPAEIKQQIQKTLDKSENPTSPLANNIDLFKDLNTNQQN